MKGIKRVAGLVIACSLVLACSTKKQADGQPAMALIMKTLSNPFFIKMGQGAQRAADSLAVPLLIGTVAQEIDINQQISLVEDMIVQGVKAILIAPVDSKAIVPVLVKAQAQGILIINLDNRIDADAAAASGLRITSYVGVDNEEGGRMSGAYLVQLLGGKGRVAMLEGIRGVDNAEARKQGFLKSLQGTGVELAASQSANWLQDQALDVFSNMLQANSDLDGLFCANDMMALGAIQALRQAGKSGQVRVTAFDNIEAAQLALCEGVLHATIDQHPELMGYYGVLIAKEALAGRVTREKLVPLELITRENLPEETK
ncbi:MAG: D-allose-binding periplasmic protein precursor [bacterium ADurb.Bin478]|nr:MAG: D-allose-binding periplasmic protein precursor [bacterium ADurb.Bin478]